MLGFLCGALGLAACSSTEQLDSIESRVAELQRQVQDLKRDAATRDDLAAIQQKLTEETAQLLRATADTATDLETLGSRIGALDEQIKESLHRIDQLSLQIATTNEELRALPHRTPASTSGEGGPQLSASDPETLYQDAYAAYRAGNYDLAVLGFAQYLETYPDTDLADNATYWMGESRFGQGQFQKAIDNFNTVISKYPRSEKVASAMLKRGYAHLQLGQRELGIEELQAVLQTHPSSEEAAIARQQLQKLEPQSTP